LVSVIIPTYNQARFIGATIESLREQSWARWECAVVDDGSTDDTARVVASHCDPRVRYLPQSRRGVERLAETLNVGLRHTTGTFVTMLGSDDLWPSYRLEAQIPAFADDEVVLCFGRGELIDEHGQSLGEYPLPSFVRPVMNRPVGSILGSLLKGNWLPQYTVLIRRTALESLGGYVQPPPLLAEDYPTHLELARRGEFRFVNRVLGYYRMHAHQQTRQHKLVMTHRDVSFALAFYHGLDPEARQLAGVTATQLERVLALKLPNAYFEEGRRMLLTGEPREARRQFLTALRHGGAATRAKALTGLVCGLLGVDLEHVAGLLGRPRLR
jgi:glycosyltransferase involved in cell wall biosynthesis